MFEIHKTIQTRNGTVCQSSPISGRALSVLIQQAFPLGKFTPTDRQAIWSKLFYDSHTACIGVGVLVNYTQPAGDD